MKISLNTQVSNPIVFHPNIANRIPSRNDVLRIAGRKRKNNIIAVCAMPKSGSTFLSNVLSKLLLKKYMPLCYAYSSNEHDLYLPAMLSAQSLGAVSQLHIKGTPHNASLFNIFNIQPIILFRNLYDALESLARDLRAKESSKVFGTGQTGYSFVWLDENTASLSDEALLDFVCDFALPWYVNFYVSWKKLEKLGVVKPIWLSYEKLMADKRSEVEALLEKLGYENVEVDDDVLGKNYISGKEGIGAGSGESGRGGEIFTKSQYERVNRLLSYYSDVDFSDLIKRSKY